MTSNFRIFSAICGGLAIVAAVFALFFLIYFGVFAPHRENWPRCNFDYPLVCYDDYVVDDQLVVVLSSRASNNITLHAIDCTAFSSRKPKDVRTDTQPIEVEIAPSSNVTINCLSGLGTKFWSRDPVLINLNITASVNISDLLVITPVNEHDVSLLGQIYRPTILTVND